MLSQVGKGSAKLWGMLSSIQNFILSYNDKLQPDVLNNDNNSIAATMLCDSVPIALLISVKHL